MKIDMPRLLHTVALPEGDERRIRLISGGIRIRWHGGAVLWLWPLAVEVDAPEWQERQAIPDVTHTAMLTLFLGAGALVGLLWLMGKWQKHA